MVNSDELNRVLLAFHAYQSPARVRDALLDQESMGRAESSLGAAEADRLNSHVTVLQDAGIGVVAVDDGRFPPGLVVRGRSVAPALFYKGNLDLLKRPLVSVSGSRDVSQTGASAATVLGQSAAAAGLCVVAGNARGVDTIVSESATHARGSAIYVLPEGISRSQFRVDAAVAEDRVLLLSQFEPDMRWSPGAAMARNRVICGLGSKLVVVEASKKGGSIAAGREALKQSKPLLVLTYGEETPAGNLMLISEGGRAVGTAEELRRELGVINAEPEQGRLL